MYLILNLIFYLYKIYINKKLVQTKIGTNKKKLKCFYKTNKKV